MAITNVKILLGIDNSDTSEDDVLTVIKDIVEKTLVAYLRTDSFPVELDFVADELTVRRYTKLGAEGVEQESIMSSSTTKYILDDLQDYRWIVDRYAQENTDTTNVGRLKMM